MASTFIKAQKVVSTTLGLLLREMMLPGVVWRDAAGDFAGAAGDTITIRLPSYTTARTRVLRAGTAITMDDLAENVVTVTLNTDVYKAVPITDEQMTLDIANFGQQVMDPVVRSVALGFEDAIAPNLGFAFHKSAYVMSTRAPVVPDGASWGATQSYGGIAMRVLRDYDFVNVRDRLLADAYLGTNIVQDTGRFDANGKFVATDQPYTPQAITSVAATDIFTNPGTNGFAAGDPVTFTGLVGGAGLVPGTTYYVIATNLTATTFSVSATPGGAIFDHTTNVTAGSVAKGGNPLFVRSVKITDLV